MGSGSLRRSTHHWASKLKLDFSKEFEEKGIPLEDRPEEVNQRELTALGSFFGIPDGEGGRKKGVMAFAAIAIASTVKSPVTPEAASLKAGSMLWKRLKARKGLLAAQHSSLALSPTSRSLPSSSLGDILASGGKLQSPTAQPCSSWRSRNSTKPFIRPGSNVMIPFDLEYKLDENELPIGFGQHAHERIHRPVTPRELVEACAPTPLSITDFPPIFRRAAERPQETHYAYFTRRIPEERPELRKVLERRTVCTRRQFGGREVPGDIAEVGRRWASTLPVAQDGTGRPQRGRFISTGPLPLREEDEFGTRRSLRSATAVSSAGLRCI